MKRRLLIIALVLAVALPLGAAYVKYVCVPATQFLWGGCPTEPEPKTREQEQLEKMVQKVFGDGFVEKLNKKISKEDTPEDDSGARISD